MRKKTIIWIVFIVVAIFTINFMNSKKTGIDASALDEEIAVGAEALLAKKASDETEEPKMRFGFTNLIVVAVVLLFVWPDASKFIFTNPIAVVFALVAMAIAGD